MSANGSLGSLQAREDPEAYRPEETRTKTQRPQPGGVEKPFPGVSMTLQTWVHDPFILGNDHMFKGSWRLKVDLLASPMRPT